MKGRSKKEFPVFIPIAICSSCDHKKKGIERDRREQKQGLNHARIQSPLGRSFTMWREPDQTNGKDRLRTRADLSILNDGFISSPLRPFTFPIAYSSQWPRDFKMRLDEVLPFIINQYGSHTTIKCEIQVIFTGHVTRSFFLMFNQHSMFFFIR
jgi:hypothetical protein